MKYSLAVAMTQEEKNDIVTPDKNNKGKGTTPLVVYKDVGGKTPENVKTGK